MITACIVCDKREFEGSFAYITFGSLTPTGGGHTSRTGHKPTFEIGWHGAHDDQVGRFREITPRIEFDDEYEDGAGIVPGQQSFRFCSLECLREWFNRIVNRLGESLIIEPESLVNPKL